MNNKLFKNKGLTLVELIISIALLGIIILFMFSFFYFNYNSFYRSNINYNVQTNLNEVLRTFEEELRFADEIKIYDNNDKIQSHNKNYIYLKDNTIKLKKINNETKNLTANDIKINQLSFQVDKNLINIDIRGEYESYNKEINNQYTMELLNFKAEKKTKGFVIEYYQTKGDDTY